MNRPPVDWKEEVRKLAGDLRVLWLEMGSDAPSALVMAIEALMMRADRIVEDHKLQNQEGGM